MLLFQTKDTQEGPALLEKHFYQANFIKHWGKKILRSMLLTRTKVLKIQTMKEYLILHWMQVKTEHRQVKIQKSQQLLCLITSIMKISILKSKYLKHWGIWDCRTNRKEKMSKMKLPLLWLQVQAKFKVVKSSISQT